ncbi:MAG: DUF4124 domain-containing protein [Anaerolineae bacterium]
MRTLITLAALLLALPAAAQVNKCVIDGKTVYQAAPCPQGAKAATLKYRHDIAEDDAKAAREDFLAREKARQTADRRLSIEREMSALERQIERYQKDMTPNSPHFVTPKALPPTTSPARHGNKASPPRCRPSRRNTRPRSRLRKTKSPLCAKS